MSATLEEPVVKVIKTSGTGTGGAGVGFAGGLAVGRGTAQLKTKPEIVARPPQSTGVDVAAGDGVADGVAVGVGVATGSSAKLKLPAAVPETQHCSTIEVVSSMETV